MQPDTMQSAFLDSQPQESQSAFTDSFQNQSSSDPTTSAFTDIQSPSTIVPQTAKMTQHYGNYNPSLEVFSGGIARDTNFAVNPETPIKVPNGQWKVISAFNKAPAKGYVGNGVNEGYGNAVLVQNTETGDKLHLIHLSHVAVNPGQIIPGGSMVGLSGSSGNATGPNLGIEYYNAHGQIQDVMHSPYARYLPSEESTHGGQGGGGLWQIIGQIGNTVKNFLHSDYQDQNAMAKGDQESETSVQNRQLPPLSMNNPGGISPLPTKPAPMPTLANPTNTEGIIPKIIQAINPHTQTAQAQTIQPTQAPISEAIGATDYEKQAAPIFEKYGIPVPIGLGIWAMEGRGKTINPNNPYNIGAYDSNPQNANAYHFKTPLEGTEAAAKFLAGQSQYMAADKKAIFQNAMQQYKKTNDIETYLRAIAPTYSSNPNYANIVESTPEYLRWAGGH